MNNNFSLLDYWTQLYGMKVFPDINITSDVSTLNKKDALDENKKKHIHIENATIEYFSDRFKQGLEENNETTNEADDSTALTTNASKRRDETPDARSEKSSQLFPSADEATEVIEI